MYFHYSLSQKIEMNGVSSLNCILAIIKLFAIMIFSDSFFKNLIFPLFTNDSFV